MEPLVSVIIPTIKERKEEYERAVKSVIHQTYQNIEIIPISGYKNPGEARNAGINKANGKYIAFLDDDDEWLPNKIEEQLKFFNPYTVLVICWVEDKRFKKTVTIKYPEVIDRKKILKQFNLASTSAYIFNADFLKNHEKFDEQFPSAQEYELAIRSSYLFSVKCAQQVLVIQHRSENQITRDWTKKRQGLTLLLNKHKPLYKKYGLLTYIGFRLRFIGLHLLYLSANLLGDRVYKIITPMKKRSG